MERLRVAMIGCGGIRRQHMSGIVDEATGIEVAAACDISARTLGSFCDRYGIEKRFSDYRELFDGADVEAVSIAVVPEELKVAIAIEALERGLHVLAEKPMALTVKEAEAMAAAARKAGRVLQVAFNQRFEPVYRRARQVIRDRATFGDVAFVRASFATASRYPYVTFMSQNPHTFDLVQYLAGRVTGIRSVERREFDAEEHARLQSKLTRPSEVAYNASEPGLVAIDAASTLKFESGAVGTLEVSTHAPGARLRGNRFEITGTRNRAVAIYDMDSLSVLSADGTEEYFTTSSWCRKESSYGLEYRHFFDWVRTGKPTVITLEDAVRSVYLYEGFLRSLRTGDEVDLVDWKE